MELKGTRTPDPLLAKSAQIVPDRPGPGLSASADLLRSVEIRARWCQLWVPPLSYGTRVARLSRVSLDDPQSACWQCLPKWGQMAFADIQDVRLAADADSYCGSGMARCPVKDPVLCAYVAGVPSRASSRCGHDCKGNCDHLIRRDLHDHVTPGQTAADLARLRSLVRVGSRRCALS